MNQRNKIFEELKAKQLKSSPVVSSSATHPAGVGICPSSSPFHLSSGPVTGSSTPAPILPNQTSNIIPPAGSFSTLEPMTPVQKILAQANQTSFGFYIPQDSNYNPILPVLPRFI